MVNQVLYVLSGVFQVLATQFLHYEGAAGSSTMLTVTATYLGMAMVGAVSREARRRSSTADQGKLFLVTLVDIIGLSILTVALFYIGSGVREIFFLFRLFSSSLAGGAGCFCVCVCVWGACRRDFSILFSFVLVDIPSDLFERRGVYGVVEQAGVEEIVVVGTMGFHWDYFCRPVAERPGIFLGDNRFDNLPPRPLPTHTHCLMP